MKIFIFINKKNIYKQYEENNQNERKWTQKNDF